MSARHNRKQMEVFGLSFLDIICCGFGAIVLLLLISPVGGMGDAPSNPENTAELQSEFFALNASIKSIEVQIVDAQDTLKALEVQTSSASKSITSLETQKTNAEVETKTKQAMADQLENALNQISERMKRVADTTKPNVEVGGLPVDSEYIAFVIDTSGSMTSWVWDDVMREMENILDIHPKVKGIQVMNDMGKYMFSEFIGKWMPDSPTRRKLINHRMKNWSAFSNSSPVEGISAAIKQIHKPGQSMSIYVLGDEFSSSSITAVLDEVTAVNAKNKSGDEVRIHALGFPSYFNYEGASSDDDVGKYKTMRRYAHLMRQLSYQNNGAFLTVGEK